MEIVPAIMPKSFSELEESMSSVSGLVPMVQVDIMDGVFTEQKSWPYIENPDVDFQEILKEEKGFPSWEKIDFEADLMISDPLSTYYDWIMVGASRVIVHVESVNDLSSFISDFKSRVPSSDSVFKTELGLALNIDTPNSDIEEFLPEVDFVQCMGIARIGYQGEPFDERVIERIKDLRERHSQLIISVDGGVSLETAPDLIEAGADRLAVGSAIFGSEDVRSAIDKFKSL